MSLSLTLTLQNLLTLTLMATTTFLLPAPCPVPTAPLKLFDIVFCSIKYDNLHNPNPNSARPKACLESLTEHLIKTIQQMDQDSTSPAPKTPSLTLTLKPYITNPKTQYHLSSPNPEQFLDQNP